MGRRNRTVKSTERYAARDPKNEWRTAIYARLSNENNGQEDDRSLLNQVRYDEDYVRSHTNLTLIDEYIDNGRTGTNFNRPEFIRLLEDVKSGRVNCIVVKDLSRFGRNYLETGYYLEKIFPFLNVRFIAINDKFDSMDESSKDALIVPIKNMMNELYAKDISRKISYSMRMKEKKGEMWYGIPPYGYLRDPENPFHMIIDEDTAPFVKLMFLWLIAGVSMGEIRDRLDQMMVPTPMMRLVELGHLSPDSKRYTKLWSQTSIRKILTNPVYLGTLVYNRSYQSLVKGVSHTKQPEENWLCIPNAHDPIVSDADFDKVQNVLKKVNEKQMKQEEYNQELRKKTPDILRGKFFCADCGRTMYYCRYMRKGSLKYCHYYCSGYRYGKREAKCGMNDISDRLVRTWVFDQIRMQIDAACCLEKLADSLGEAAGYRNKKKALEERITELKQKVAVQGGKRHRLYEDFADGMIDEEDYRSFKETYDERYQELTALLVLAVSELAELEKHTVQDDEWAELKQKVYDIKRLTPELVQEMIERIEYGADGTFRIAFRHKDWVSELIKAKEAAEI